MVFCPECKNELPDGTTECYICGHDLSDTQETDWVMLGAIDNKLYADFAKETLTSYGIPAVVISKDGFFGSIGLPLRPFYDSKSAPFEILVPVAYCKEAIEILDMTVGDKWHKKEN